ncbi:MAG: VWA domain-containing protein [Gammaproteobacteria bacterium]|nr:VWA domain-containing protein [Gammaproteobacteria bacterium]
MSETELAENPNREKLNCGFEQIDPVFDDLMEEASALLSEQGVEDYLAGASLICMIGRGVEPVLSYLQDIPAMADHLGEEIVSLVSQTVWKFSRTINGKAIPVFLQTLPAVARRLGDIDALQSYFDIIFDMMDKTSVSIHGHHATIPSPSLSDLLEKMPYLISQLSLVNLKNWVDYGIRFYSTHPERQRDFFSLQSADSLAILQRERQGTLFYDHERKLNLYMQGLWDDDPQLVPYSLGFDELRKPVPYFDALGLRIPDVYDDTNDVSGIDRYRATLAHMAAHQRWTRPIIADNYSPFQRMAVEFVEDARVEYLAIQQYPGLRQLFIKLHPRPIEGACDPETQSCLRHRMAMLSLALLDPAHGYTDPDILEFVDRFHDAMANGESSTKNIAGIGLSYVARTRIQSDQLANIFFDDTEINYRDDNRHMWTFIEEGDEEESFDDNRQTQAEEEELKGLPPRHYPEWDYHSQSYRPDWVSVYEALHPSGKATDIDKLLDKHSAVLKRMKRVLELLKPQNYVRVRYQEEGSELDLDIAIRSLIDLKSGSQPDPRINMSHKHDGRDIAVMLLLDLSQSTNDIPQGATQTILELCQESVSLLSWSIEQLGDKFAIAGFHSNTRHDVKYHHIKGFSEHWDDEVKGRIAGMKSGYSTRMGAAMRHAAHYLEAQKADKKLLLVLTDGEPADIDVDDEQLLIQDTHKAVQELDQQGIYSYCITLDPNADDYVTDIFGNQHMVIDNVNKLPEKLPALFASLTK